MNILIKKISYLTFTIFLLFSYILHAQNTTALNCGTKTTPQSLEYINSLKPKMEKYERAFMLKKSNKGTSVKVINSIPIKAHIIRSSKGTGGLSVSELNNAISNLNAIFANAYMEFFLCDGINYINDDALCYYKKSDENDLIERNNVPNLINIYITDYVENASHESICGYSNNTKGNDFIVIKTSCMTNNSSLAHELGHFFSLMHTHGPNDTTTELVNGNNCDTDGDGICDTPADPKLSSDTINNFCEYTGNLTDENGDHYNPLTNNMMSYSLKGCRTVFTPQQLARIYAYYLTTKNYFSCPSFNTDISVNNSQTCEESLTVNFSNTCLNATQWEWDINSDGIIDYTTQNPVHTYQKGVYDVTLKVSNKSKTITKTYSNFIKVGTPSGYLNESFEQVEILGDHGWTAIETSGNGFSWLLNSGETPSKNTGPINNEKPKNTYIYAEASNGKPGDITEFISPCIDVINENTQLSFSYHMFGVDIGELHVDIKTDSGYVYDVINPLYGNKQDNQNEAFITQVIDLASYTNQTVKVCFRAIRGNGWYGDIAIDDVFVKTIDTSITDNHIIKVYPNPISETLYIKANHQNEITNYSISNVFGQVFLSGIATNTPIDVSHLPSGTFLLTVSNATSTVVKKIVK